MLRSALHPIGPRMKRRRQLKAFRKNAPMRNSRRRWRSSIAACGSVARGHATIDARLDLHGMTQTQAHAALLHFLMRAQAQDAKLALVVTGKGMGGAVGSASERGVLRRQVPLWLSLPEFRRFIVSFQEAHASHGGEGALHLRVRRRPR